MTEADRFSPIGIVTLPDGSIANFSFLINANALQVAGISQSPGGTFQFFLPLYALNPTPNGAVYAICQVSSYVDLAPSDCIVQWRARATVSGLTAQIGATEFEHSTDHIHRTMPLVIGQIPQVLVDETAGEGNPNALVIEVSAASSSKPGSTLFMDTGDFGSYSLLQVFPA